jgi:hypothetical protein
VVRAAQILSALDPGRIRSGPLPSAEIDRSGRIYVTWEDCRFEPGCRANDLVLITSTDGRDWTPPRRIPIDPVGSGVDHFLPGLAVDRTTSDGSAHLGLAFYYLSECELWHEVYSRLSAGCRFHLVNQWWGQLEQQRATGRANEVNLAG